MIGPGSHDFEAEALDAVPSLLSVCPHLEFHHLGLACANIEKEIRDLEILGYVPESDEFIDPIQGIRGRFLVGQGPRLELVAPLGTEGVLTPWLKNKVKLYHMAFMAASINDAVSAITRARGKLVVSPVPAVGFSGRQIAFLMLRNLLLIEVIAADVAADTGASSPPQPPVGNTCK